MSEAWTAVRAAWPEPAASHPALWSAYAAILAGEGPSDEQLAATTRAARAQHDAAQVCDLTTLRALRLLVVEDLGAATELARTASRMARTEALQASECFASVVLARARRLNGEPHRATRILQALLGYAHPAFHEWIEWELVMSGHELSVRTPLPRALQQLLTHRDHGRRAEGEAALAALIAASETMVLRRQDLAVLATSCRFDVLAAARPRAVEAWQRGEGADLPWGLAGLSASAEPVHVVVAPGARGQRVLDTGLPLLEPLLRLAPTPGAQHRSDALLAALALAGPAGETDARIFAAVYGFPFVRATHQGVLDVLVHRTRARLGALARIDRIAEGYALVALCPFAARDPRSAARDDDRVLRLVASSGRLTARQAASTLGVSLRKAQQVLDSLAASGACVQVRAGRHFEYQVEDTTFQEPTGVRPR